MSNLNKKQETLALHAGYDPNNEPTGSIAVPLYPNTAYVFEDSQSAVDVFALKKSGYIYTRLNNPTTNVLEERLAAVEGGLAAVATSCGQSAIATLLLTLLKSGDHIVAGSSVYGGTFNLLNHTLPKYGITSTLVDFQDSDSVSAAIKSNTKLIFTEVLGNPKLNFTDTRKLADLAHSHGLPLIVDNTVTAGLYRPLLDGADVEVLSLTKNVCGNGTTLGGAIIDTGNYDWSNGLFKEFIEPSESYHGLIFSQAFGKAALIARIRTEGLRDLGSCISPRDSWEIIQGLETLTLRLEKISANCLEIAHWLEQDERIKWVRYPGLSSHPQHEDIAKKLDRGFGPLLTFSPKGGYNVAKVLAEQTEIFKLVANLGDTKSLIIHPASTTHSQLTEAEQLSAGVSSDLIRLSVGLESTEDLIADLDQALNKALLS